MSRHHRGATVLVLAVAGVIGVARALRADAPGQINFQARLTDAMGKPLPDGTLGTVAFQIFGDPAAVTTMLWGEAQANVPITRGIVSVRLGNGAQAIDANFNVTAPGPNPVPAGIFDGAVKYVRIRVNTDPPLAPLVPLVSVPYALSAASLNGVPTSQITVPVGAIMDWFPPSAGAVPPSGWMVCDGSLVADSGSPYYQTNVPDLRQKVTRGISPSAASSLGPGSLPDTGGQDTVSLPLGHSHSLAPHTHSLPDHTHNYSGVTDPPNASAQMVVTGVFHQDNGFDNHTHNYAGTTGSASYASGFGPVTGAGGGGATGSGLGNVPVSTIPTYVGLLKIIRIK